MTPDERLGRHVDEQLPERLAFDLGVQVPDGIDDRRRREMDDALFGPHPAELAVPDELVPERGEVIDDGGQGATDDHRPERRNGGHTELVAAAGGERDAVTLEAVRSGRPEGHVGSRVVGSLVHRVRPVERVGRREPDVERDDLGDRDGHGTDSGLEWGSGIGVPEGGGLGHPWELASYLNR